MFFHFTGRSSSGTLRIARAGCFTPLRSLFLFLVWTIPFFSCAPTFLGAQTRNFVDRSYLVGQPIQALSGPFTVALQPGHWQIDQLPDELARRRTSTGASYGKVREVDINRAVVDALVPLLKAKGWNVIVVPATIPIELRADAFVSVHADWGDNPAKNGWKLSPPWRSSPASLALAAAMKQSFAAEKNLNQDPAGPSINMRGYFGFNYIRYEHAISPFTPAILVELGFLTNATERALLTGKPTYWAGILARGLTAYFATYDRTKTENLRPPVYSWQMAFNMGADVRSQPAAGARLLWHLKPGDIVMPVDKSGSWYEVFVRGHRGTGWVMTGQLLSASDPHWPMPGEEGRD